MGCASSQTAAVEAESSTRTPTPAAAAHKYPASEAFVVSLRSNATTMISLGDSGAAAAEQAAAADGDGGVKAPPKRIQKLLEETAPLTRAQLDEKLQRAEQRRRELLQQRVESVQKAAPLLGVGSMEEPSDSVADRPDKDATTTSTTATTTPMTTTTTAAAAAAQSELATTLAYAQEIKAKALDDDSKQELLTTTATAMRAASPTLTAA